VSMKACCGLLGDRCLRRRSIATQTRYWFVKSFEQNFKKRDSLRAYSCEAQKEKKRRKRTSSRSLQVRTTSSPRKFPSPSVQAYSTNLPLVMSYFNTDFGLRHYQAVAGVNCSCLNTQTCLGCNEQHSNKRTATESETNHPSQRFPSSCGTVEISNQDCRTMSAFGPCN
jgi:hypothetical protein